MTQLKNTYKGLAVTYIIDYYYGNKKDCTKVGQTTYLKKRISNYKSQKKYTKAIIRYIVAFDSIQMSLDCEDAFRAYLIAQGGVQFGKDQIRKRHFQKSDIPNLNAIAQNIQAD